MTGHDHIDPTPDEASRGRDALRELRVEPLPDDVRARLDGRLEGELGRPAPVRRRWRSRLLFAIPGVAVAGVAAVVVAVLVTNGNGTGPTHDSAFSLAAGSAAPAAPSASKSLEKVTHANTASDAVALVQVPSLVGRSLVKAGTIAGRDGLHVKLIAKPCPSTTPDRVVHQRPAAGGRTAPGSTIRISVC
jgi:hypothetical protein